MALIAYARVSVEGHTFETQVGQLKAAGAEKISNGKTSGARVDRLQLKKAIAIPNSDGVLLVTRLDRFARSPHDLLPILDETAREPPLIQRGALIRGFALISRRTSFRYRSLTVTVQGR